MVDINLNILTEWLLWEAAAAAGGGGDWGGPGSPVGAVGGRVARVGVHRVALWRAVEGGRWGAAQLEGADRVPAVPQRLLNGHRQPAVAHLAQLVGQRQHEPRVCALKLANLIHWV